MGIDIGAKIIVGLSAEKFKESLYDDIDLDDYFCGISLTTLSPYFDAPLEDCIWGITVYDVDYTYQKVPSTLLADIEHAHQSFEDVTGLVGELYFGPNVW